MVGMKGEMKGILKVVLEGFTASFRYPHFVQGIHLTYEMPPPATIYGLISAVVGDYFDPQAMRFAIHFCYRAKFEDYEHLHFPPADIKKKEDRAFYKQIQARFGTADLPPAINPFVREMLFEPTLTLYLDQTVLDGIDLMTAFRQPRYPVVLGRSQDLMSIRPPEIINLSAGEPYFVSGTLLSLAEAAQVGGQFYAVTMPRYISPARQVEWGQYAVLPDTRRPPIQHDGLRLNDEPVWVDTGEHHPTEPTLSRAVCWHSWTA
jgi:CRISPR-associated protein Cas5t